MLKVCCALIINRGKILITQLDEDSDHPFRWEFPGGKIFENEFPETCVKREVKEELEIEIKILSNMEPIIYDYGFRKIQLIPFICSIISGKIKLNNHCDYKWVELNHLSEYKLAEADRKLIENQRNVEILKKYFREKMNNTR